MVLSDLVQRLRGQLLGRRRRTVELEELQRLAVGCSYEVFAAAVRELVSAGVLVPVMAAGTDYTGLGRRFRLGRQALAAGRAEQVQREARERHLSARLALGWYYTQPESVWREELPLLEMLSRWLEGRRLLDTASLQQRSYDIFLDEKLLLERGELLAHVGLTRELLGVVEVPEPLMLAVNVAGLQVEVCHHLVVENKAPYVRLLPFLAESGFASLVLGYGWKVAGNLALLPQQCGRRETRQVCWYFGDFDWEGLAIWDSLQQKDYGVEVRLAVPFYRMFLRHEMSQGKDNQAVQPEVLERFCRYFSADEAEQWREVLEGGGYYPQEALSEAELIAAWQEIGERIGKLCD